jgi:hypothetical protein
MAENDIVALKELASGGFLEVALAPADIAAAPASHTHAAADITDLNAAAAGALYDGALGIVGAVVTDSNLRLINGDDHEAILGYEHITSNRFINLPDASGTLALNPLTTAGDIVVGGTSGAPARLALGTASQQLRVNSGATSLEYFTPAAAFDPASPGAIGNTTAAAATFTTLTANTSLTLNGTGAAELVNGTSAAGDFRIYRTTSSANANYERGFIRWGGTSSNTLQIGTEKLGTGTARALEFQTDGVSRWTIASNGILSASSASRLNLNSLSFQHYAGGNALIAENCEFAGAWRYIASGAAGMFYFLGAEGQFRFFASGSALAGLPNGGNSTQFKVNADGTVALGGTGVFNAGVYTDNTLAVNATTATFKDATNIVVGTTTGTKIGTSTSQKIGFFNKTPVVQPTAVADATDAATVITQLNALLSRMRDLGLIAT